MGAGFGAPPAAVPPAFTAPVSGGLDDLFDLGGGVGMPMGVYSPPKTVSFDSAGDISLSHIRNTGPKNRLVCFFSSFR